MLKEPVQEFNWDGCIIAELRVGEGDAVGRQQVRPRLPGLLLRRRRRAQRGLLQGLYGKSLFVCNTVYVMVSFFISLAVLNSYFNNLCSQNSSHRPGNHCCVSSPSCHTFSSTAVPSWQPCLGSCIALHCSWTSWKMGFWEYYPITMHNLLGSPDGLTKLSCGLVLLLS